MSERVIVKAVDEGLAVRAGGVTRRDEECRDILEEPQWAEPANWQRREGWIAFLRLSDSSAFATALETAKIRSFVGSPEFAQELGTLSASASAVSQTFAAATMSWMQTQFPDEVVVTGLSLCLFPSERPSTQTRPQPLFQLVGAACSCPV